MVITIAREYLLVSRQDLPVYTHIHTCIHHRHTFLTISPTPIAAEDWPASEERSPAHAQPQQAAHGLLQDQTLRKYRACAGRTSRGPRRGRCAYARGIEEWMGVWAWLSGCFVVGCCEVEVSRAACISTLGMRSPDSTDSTHLLLFVELKTYIPQPTNP